MFLRNHSKGLRTIGFFRNYFILGIIVLAIIFFLYSNWVTKRLEREISQFSTMLATFAAQLPAIADKETSDAAKKIIDNLEFPFVIMDSSGQPKAARGIGNGLREKIIAGTLTASEKQYILKLVKEMDKKHKPIPMRLVEQDRKIIGYFYYDQIDWAINEGSSFVITDVSDEPVFWRNISGTEEKSKNPDVIHAILKSFIEKSKSKGLYTTLQFNPVSQLGYFHFGDTGIIHELPFWMPLAQISLVIAFLLVGLIGYQRIKYNEQQAIWVGLAKETAHQLGTPISSLMGWLDILKDRSENNKELSAISKDMQSDIERLKDISSRFGEIGSIPKRELMDVSDVIHRAVLYFQKRLPNRQKHVEIIESYQNVPKVAVNENLLQWVIENLIRNSLDAIDKEKGRIHIKTEYDSKKKDVLIIYRDNGKGISKKNWKKVFAPGFSTKKHGWGLGLAIFKRIIESYHNGHVNLVESDSKGSTFVIELPASV